MERLTLCMIVRDEEAMLPACLDSVRDVVDRMVVVDTGSADRTPDIAREAGAEVVPHAWSDDFAEARNAALEHVDDGWILVLDADERLAPGAGAELRRRIEGASFDCGLLPLHDATALDAPAAAVLDGSRRKGAAVLVPRLLRRTPDLRWEGMVHEQVTSWLRGGRSVARIDAAIVHYGAVEELRHERGKHERNLRLLEKHCARNPSDSNGLAFLARELIRVDRAEEALEMADRSWNALVEETGDGEPRSDIVLPATLRTFLSLDAGRLQEAAETIERAASWGGRHPNIDVLHGAVAERIALQATDVEQFADLLEEARLAYERCLTRDGETFLIEVMPGATGWVARTRLGTIHLLAGRPAEALREFDLALADHLGLLEASIGRVEALLDADEVQRALEELQPLLEADTPDGWVLGAACAEAFGRADDARLFAHRARETLAGRDWLGAFRAGRLVELESRLGSTPGPGPAPAPTPAMPAAHVEITDGDDDDAGIEPRDYEDPTSIRVEDRNPAATVVIPAYNRLDLLRPVLEGFAAEAENEAFELLVVDDGSEPAVESILGTTRRPKTTRVIRRPNGGRGPALNTGLAAATGSVVIFCDSDIVPAPGFVRDHVDFHRAHTSELATHLGGLDWGVDPGLYGALVGPRSNPRLREAEGDVPWTVWFTDNWSFKRRLLTERGLGFDEAYRAWGWEEIDLAQHLVRLGATNTATGRARGSHLKAPTPEGMMANFAASVPNLLHITETWSDEPVLQGGLGMRFANPKLLELCEDVFGFLWAEVQAFDERSEGGLRDVADPAAQALACEISDAVFRIGIARGFEQLGPVALDGRALPPASDGELLLRLADPFAHLLVLQLAREPSADAQAFRDRLRSRLDLPVTVVDAFLRRLQAVAAADVEAWAPAA